MSLQQRKPSTPYIKSVRPMVRSDLEFLRQKSARTTVVKLRESHHVVARLLASGMKQAAVADAVGYTPTRVSILANTPSVRELIAKYRGLDDEAWRETRDEFYATKLSNMAKADRLIADKLDDAINGDGDEIPLKTLVSISGDAADRVGYHKKSTKENINIDFAARLEMAIARSREVRVIEHEE